MRRRIVLTAAVIAAGGFVLARSARRAAPDAAGPAEIAPGVFCLGPRGRTQTNVYLVRAGVAWFLVDAGWAADAERIRAALRELAGATARPAMILLTHVHPDHAGAAPDLARDWGCPVLVHPAELGVAAGDFAEMQRVAGPLDRWLILPVMQALGERRRRTVIERSSMAGLVRALEPGGMLPGMDGWAWIATPGHTPGHVAFVRPSDGVALTGDALLTLAVNTLGGVLAGRQGLSGPPWYTTWDAAAARESIAALAAMRPSVVGPGHGSPRSGGGLAAAIERFAAG